MKTTIHKHAVIIALAFAFGGALLFAADHSEPSMAPGPALAKLKAGNEQFASEAKSPARATRERRLETANSQHPFAIVVGCSDSRTPPEMIFDQNIGDLFVVRTAGEVVGDYELGSIEYAVEHLGARLIVVLGHARCGAVQAAVAGETAPGPTWVSIVRNIRPAVLTVSHQPGDPLKNAIESNVEQVAAQIQKQAELGALASEVKVVRAYNDFDSGKVEWLEGR